MSRSVEDIKREITSVLGFIPPFFEPAFWSAHILEDLWHQTLYSYLKNPLPDVFKETLAALLARYCDVPYCLLCHSSCLRPLGLSSQEIISLLEMPLQSFDEIKSELSLLKGKIIQEWPLPGSKLEKAILGASLAVFLHHDAKEVQGLLRESLGREYFDHLSIFIGYNKVALNWAEHHPEISYIRDKRYIDNFNHLLNEKPEFADLFANYQERVMEQDARKNRWIKEENRRLIESERKKIFSYFEQAPVGFAVVKEPELRFVFANDAFLQLIGKSKVIGTSIRQALTDAAYAWFLDNLDSAYRSGKGFANFGLELKEKVFVNLSVQAYRDENENVSGLIVIINEVTNLFTTMRELEEEKRQAMEARKYLETTLMSIGDAVITTTAGNPPLIDFLNPVAEALTGWNLSEARGKDVAEVFNIIHMKTRKPAIDPIAKVLKDGKVVGLANHTAIISKSGKEYIIEDSAAPIKDENGKISGVVLVFRDVTEKHQLQAETELLNAVVANSKDFIGIADPEGNALFVNEAGRRLVGIDSLSEVKNTKIIDYFAEEDKAEIVQELLPAAISEGAWDGEVYFQNFKTGKKIPMSWNLFTITDDESGKITAFACVSKDLTELKRREAAEIEARGIQLAGQQKLVNLLTEMPLAVSLLEGPDHRYSFINDIYYNLFGGRRDMIGKTVAEGLTEHERSRLIPLLDAVYRTGVSYKANEFPIDLIQVDGSIKHFYLNFSYDAMRDAKGNVHGIAVTVADVTNEVVARRSIEQSENKMRTLANSMPQIVWESNSAGSISYTNQKWHEVFGEQLPTHWYDKAHPEDIHRVREEWEDHVKSGHAYESILKFFRDTDQSYRSYLVRAEPYLQPEGRIWYGSLTDIESQSRIEAELKQAKIAADSANETKSAFLANMSHEIRTPLGAIMGYAELLQAQAGSTADQADWSRTILKNSDHLLNLVNDILDLSKVESGKMELETQKVEFAGLIKEVEVMLLKKATDKGLNLSFAIDGKIPTHLTTDPTRFKQILINVIGNAVKFTEIGFVTAKFSLNCAQEKCTLTIEVSDSGRGINESQVRRLFEPFMQADSTTTRQFGGTGLGLALSRKIAQAMDGDVKLLKSTPGLGSTFRITVGVPKSDVENLMEIAGKRQDASNNLPVSTSPAPLQDKRILLVEDTIDNQRLISHFLRVEGAKVEIEPNGLQGVARGLRENFDVILMDIQMPVLDGYEASRRLRSGGYHGPIIALTAHAMVEEKRKALEAGCNQTITKPINYKLLVATLVSLVNSDQKG